MPGTYRFVDGTFRTIDLGPKLASSVGLISEPLRDIAFFAQVSVDPEIGTVVWPNGADIAPDVIHEGAFAEAAATSCRRLQQVVPPVSYATGSHRSVMPTSRTGLSLILARPQGDRLAGTVEDPEPSECVYVIDDQGRVHSPFRYGVSAIGANMSDRGWSHSPESGLGVIRIELIEVHVARRALGPVLVWSDHGEMGW